MSNPLKPWQHWKLGRAAWGYFKDPEVGWWRKASGFLAVAYALWPLDAIPDFVPGIGWLDDVGVLGAVAFFLLRDIRRHESKPREPT
jgi:uncharacterized membrane protein YkvA (DUF1232 family)